MIMLSLAAAAVFHAGKPFVDAVMGKELGAAESLIGAKFEHVGTSRAGLEVYIYYRTPDHSAGSPYLMVGLRGGRIASVGQTTGTGDGPVWLGEKYARPTVFQIPWQDVGVIPGNHPRPTPAPKQADDLHLAPQQDPQGLDASPDQPLQDDEHGDLPGNLVF